MQADPKTYIWPPRPTARIPIADAIVLYGDLCWIAQLKYNDTRLLIKYLPDGNIELWNRHAEKLRSYHAPDWLLQQLQDVKEILNLKGYCLLDGGLLDQKHRAIKDTIVIWDILVNDGEHLLDTQYLDRYNTICPNDDTPHWDGHGESTWYWCDNLFDMEPMPFGTHLTQNIFVPRNIKASEWEEAWAFVERINKPFVEADPPVGPLLEGLVFKDKEGVLEMGWREKNNDSWQARSRVATGRHAF
jgi:hypothetical protein